MRPLVQGLCAFTMEELVLDFNKISDVGAGDLSSLLCFRIFPLQCNFVGNSGALAIAQGLNNCHCLSKLDLQGNAMGNEGVVAIAKAAENLVKLKLYLCNVNVTMEGVRTALVHKPTAELEDLVLGLSWKSIVSSDIYSLDKAMSCGHLPMLELISSDFINKVESLVATNEHIRKTKGLQLCKARHSSSSL